MKKIFGKLDMKRFEVLVKSLSVIFGLSTVGFFIYHFIISCMAETYYIDGLIYTFFNVFKDVSSLIQLTVVVLALYVAVKKWLQTQEENNNRWKKEKKQETLKYCDFYLTDLQEVYGKLVKLSTTLGAPVKFKELNKYTRKELEEKCPDYFAKLEENYDKFILRSLHKFKSFSTMFLEGILDKDLGKKVIGSLYCSHMESLKGFIAYNQLKGTESEFLFMNIVKLLDEWKEKKQDTQLEIDFNQ